MTPKHVSSSYIIDLAGVQFGVLNTGFETSVYVRKYGNAIYSIAPWGIAKSHLGYLEVHVPGQLLLDEREGMKSV
jgi:hypothetical protein